MHRDALSLSLRQGTTSAWTLIGSICDLVNLLRVQGKFAEAESLLREALDYLQNGPRANVLLQPAVFERFVWLYEAWDQAAANTGKAQITAEWKKKLEEVAKPKPNDPFSFEISPFRTKATACPGLRTNGPGRPCSMRDNRTIFCKTTERETGS